MINIYSPICLVGPKPKIMNFFQTQIMSSLEFRPYLDQLSILFFFKKSEAKPNMGMKLNNIN